MTIRKVVEAHYDSYLDIGTWYVLKTARDWNTVLVDVYSGGKKTHTRTIVNRLQYGIGFLQLVNEFVNELPSEEKE